MKQQENRAVIAWRGAASAGLVSSANMAYMKAPHPCTSIPCVANHRNTGFLLAMPSGQFFRRYFFYLKKWEEMLTKSSFPSGGIRNCWSWLMPISGTYEILKCEWTLRKQGLFYVSMVNFHGEGDIIRQKAKDRGDKNERLL